MFGFGKRKREAAKQEALAIGLRHVEVVNATLEHWSTDVLNMRRGLLDEFFAERLVSIDGDDEMSYEMTAEIEALALTKNWLEGVESYANEFWQMLDEETIGVVDVLGIRDEVNQHVYDKISEASAMLERDVNLAIDEAITRRGEVPTSRA